MIKYFSLITFRHIVQLNGFPPTHDLIIHLNQSPSGDSCEVIVTSLSCNMSVLCEESRHWPDTSYWCGAEVPLMNPFMLQDRSKTNIITASGKTSHWPIIADWSQQHYPTCADWPYSNKKTLVVCINISDTWIKCNYEVSVADVTGLLEAISGEQASAAL